MQQYAIPNGPVTERLRFDRAYHLVRTGATWRPMREARLPQPYGWRAAGGGLRAQPSVVRPPGHRPSSLDSRLDPRRQLQLTFGHPMSGAESCESTPHRLSAVLRNLGARALVYSSLLRIVRDPELDLVRLRRNVDAPGGVSTIFADAVLLRVYEREQALLPP